VTVGEQFRSGSGVEFHLDRGKRRERKTGQKGKDHREGNREFVTVTGAVATGSCKD
jgi:hypothetical protein